MPGFFETENNAAGGKRVEESPGDDRGGCLRARCVGKNDALVSTTNR